MAEKKRTFDDAFDMFRNIHNNLVGVRAKGHLKAVKKIFQNLQEENKKLKEQVTASAGQACAIQPHDPRHMVNLLQVIEEVIPTVDFDKLAAHKIYEFNTLDAGQQLMIYIPQLLKTIDPDKEYEFCSIWFNHKSIQNVPLDFNAKVRQALYKEFKEHTADKKNAIIITCGSVKDSGLYIKINETTKFLNTYYKPHYFDGQNPHWFKDWKSDRNGDRISLVFYTRGKKCIDAPSFIPLASRPMSVSASERGSMTVQSQAYIMDSRGPLYSRGSEEDCFLNDHPAAHYIRAAVKKTAS